MMDIPLNLSEISAEMLLDYLYPDSGKQWVSRDKGAFYRNYNPDILGIDEENRLVKLSRDGFLRLLPQGMIVREDELKGDDVKERYNEIHTRYTDVSVSLKMPFCRSIPSIFDGVWSRRDKFPSY